MVSSEMGTSGGEPRTLLNALKPMLGLVGDIKSPQDVVTIISLMKDAEKLMARCIYLNILKATINVAENNLKSSETLDKFVAAGGWNIMNKWILEAKKTDNFPVLLEILEVLKDLPVTVEILKQGNTGKVVKHLTKVEDQDVKTLAAMLITKWMKLVKTAPLSAEGKGKPEDGAEGRVNNSSPSGKRQREDGHKSQHPPEKKPKGQNDVKTVKNSLSSIKAAKKLNPPPSKTVVMESAGFMDALTSAASVAPTVRKKKKAAAAPAKKTSSSSSDTPLTTSSTTAGSDIKPAYAGPLEEILNSQIQTHKTDEKEVKDKNKDAQKVESGNKSPSPTGEEAQDSPSLPLPAGDAGDFEIAPVEVPEKKEEKPEEAMEGVETEKPVTTEPVVIEGNETPKLAKNGKKKKTVSWPEDDNKLSVYHYFEMDENERVIHPVNFHEQTHLQIIRERQLTEQAKRLNEDKMKEKINWYKPKLLELVAAVIIEAGERSEEKKIQKEREAGILADIFFSKSSLPESPAEPEDEIPKDKNAPEPKIIPHDEKGTSFPPPKASTPSSTSGIQLPPALASLLAQTLKGPVGGPTPNEGSEPSVNVQNILSKLRVNSSGNPTPVNSQGQQPPGNQAQQGPHSGPSTMQLKQILEPFQNRPNPQMGPGQGMPPRGPGGPMGPGGPVHHIMGPDGPRFGPRGPYGPRHRLPPGMVPGMDPGRFPGPHMMPGPHGPRFAGPEGPRFMARPLMQQRLAGPDQMGAPMVPHPRHAGPRPVGLPGPRPGGPPGPGNNMENENFQPQGEEMSENSDVDFASDDFDSEAENFTQPMGPRIPHRGGLRGRGRGRGRGAPICRHFTSMRGCLRGDNCHFLHPGINGPPQ